MTTTYSYSLKTPFFASYAGLLYVIDKDVLTDYLMKDALYCLDASREAVLGEKRFEDFIIDYRNYARCLIDLEKTMQKVDKLLTKAEEEGRVAWGNTIDNMNTLLKANKEKEISYRFVAQSPFLPQLQISLPKLNVL